MDIPNYLTTKELMDILKVSRDSIVRWRKDNMPYKKINGTVRFDLKEVLRWIEIKTGKKTVFFDNKKDAEVYKELTRSISLQVAYFYKNVNEIIEMLSEFIDENKKQEVMVLLNELNQEKNKVFMLGEMNQKLIHNNIINIFECFENHLITFEPDIIIKLCKMINSILIISSSESPTDELIRKLIHLNSSITGFNETYKMSATMMTTMQLYSKEGDSDASNEKQ